MALKDMKHKKSDRIAYVFFYIYYLLSRIFPLRTWLFIGRYLGLLLYFIDAHHRKIAIINLQLAFGKEKSGREIHAIAREHFRQLGMNAQEWVRLKGLTETGLQRILNNIDVKGKEHILAAKKKNRSVILLGAHFGNWEYAHLYFANTINRLNFIVRKLDNALLEQERTEYNKNFNVNILYKENNLRTALKNLKNGEDLVIFTDRKAGLREGIPSQFFGVKSSTIPLVSALVKKYRLPVVPMFITRCKDMIHHQIIFLPELKLGEITDELIIQKGTQIQNDTIEKIIRMYPDHWLWVHRKWKCYHPEIYK